MILSENCKLKIYNTSDESDKDTMKVETGETDGDTKERGDQDIQDLFDATITLKADEIYDIGGKAKSSEPTVLWRRNGRDIKCYLCKARLDHCQRKPPTTCPTARVSVLVHRQFHHHTGISQGST
jgi:hypothetical protein